VADNMGGQLVFYGFDFRQFRHLIFTPPRYISFPARRP
jgi:hypothetical protein